LVSGALIKIRQYAGMPGMQHGVMGSNCAIARRSIDRRRPDDIRRNLPINGRNNAHSLKCLMDFL
jgi:hypothetical protein